MVLVTLGGLGQRLGRISLAESGSGKPATGPRATALRGPLSVRQVAFVRSLHATGGPFENVLATSPQPARIDV